MQLRPEIHKRIGNWHNSFQSKPLIFSAFGVTQQGVLRFSECLFLVSGRLIPTKRVL